MKTIKLHNGKTFRASSAMSDAEIQRAVKEFIIKPEAKPQEIKLINLPEYPKLPAFPEPKDYTKQLQKIADAFASKKDNDALKELKVLHKSMTLLVATVEQQTKALVDAMTMQAEVMAELVVAYREPKKIFRDDKGRPEGIENVRQ